MNDPHDLRRRRMILRVFVGGVAIGVLSALVLAVLGFDGRAGFASLVLFGALGAIAAALVGVAFAIVDEARHDRVSRRRTWQIVLSFSGAVWGVLILMHLSSA